MTRAEFESDVTTISELMDFCFDNNIYSITERIYDDDAKDEIYNERLADEARGRSWREMLDYLSDIPDNYDYYLMDDYGDLVGIGDYEFRDLFVEVEEWGDDNDIWDEEDEEEDDEENEAELEDEEELPMISGLFSDCAAEYQWIIEGRKAV